MIYIEHSIKEESIFRKILCGTYEKSDNAYFPAFRINWAGIIGFNGISRKYSDEKIFLNENAGSNGLIFKMLNKIIADPAERSFLNDYFLVEPEMIINDVKSGFYDNLLPYMFLAELRKILEYGIVKLYEKREDDLNFVKGKVLIRGQLINDIKRRAKISCSYSNLTTDNFFNIVLLYVARYLSSSVRLPANMRYKLSLCSSLIANEFVSDEIITPWDFHRKRKIPDRYKRIIPICNFIINGMYHSGDNKNIKCPSFMINLAELWESFLRTCIRTEFRKHGWDVEKTETLLKILEPSPRAIPDIVAKKGNTIIIFDAKYKTNKTSMDLYQICAYLGSFYYSKSTEKTRLVGFLLYYGKNNNIGNSTKPIKYFPEGSSHEFNLNINILQIKDLVKNSSHVEEISKGIYNLIEERLHAENIIL